MPIDPEQADVIRQELEAADTVHVRDLKVIAEGDAVVLHGAVANFEELGAASAIAEQHADAVRSELRVDTNLREDADDTTGTSAGAEDVDGLRAGSTMDPGSEGDDLVSDVQESLDENVPWDPPHEAVEVPTRAEARGVGGGRQEER